MEIKDGIRPKQALLWVGGAVLVLAVGQSLLPKSNPQPASVSPAATKIPDKNLTKSQKISEAKAFWSLIESEGKTCDQFGPAIARGLKSYDMTNVYENAHNGGDTCLHDAGVIAEAPIPADAPVDVAKDFETARKMASNGYYERGQAYKGLAEGVNGGRMRPSDIVEVRQSNSRATYEMLMATANFATGAKKWGLSLPEALGKTRYTGRKRKTLES